MKVYTAEEMSRADSAAQELGIPGGVLMERAGAAMAGEIMRRYPPRRLRSLGLRALVVAGGGNNGGDGFVIARELHRSGVEVTVVATKDDYSGDPATNLAVLRNLGVEVHGPEMLGELLTGAGLVVDALLGTGFSGEVREKEAGLIRQLNNSGIMTAAVDVPSGVNGSTGEVEGEAVEADFTLCAHAAKTGCLISPGREYAGEVVTVEIGIPPEADTEPSATLTDADSLKGIVPRTTEPAHKYSAGSLVVVAGSRQATGAAIMSVHGAQKAGCGIVFLVTAESVASAVDLQITEALVSGAPQSDAGNLKPEAADLVLQKAERASAIAIGPAIGTGDESRRFVEGVLSGTDLPVILDADAVTSLSGSGALAKRDAPTVITPHAGELGRLLGEGAGEISARRLYHARRAVEEYGCCVLLKGSDTLIVDGERTAINSTGSVALATAGTGDILTGILGALLSRGLGPYDAARTAAWTHGRAAELWLEETGYPRESLVATDLLPYLPRAFGELV